MSIAALLIIVLSSFLHAGWNILAKKSSGDFGVIFNGIVLAALIGSPFVIGHLASVPLQAWIYLLTAGILQAVYFVFLGESYQLEDVSFIYPVSRGCGVLGLSILGFFFLAETPSALGVFGLFLISLGTFLFAIKGRVKKSRIAYLYALATGLILSVAYLLSRMSVGLVTPSVFMVTMYLVTALALIPYVLLKHKKVCVEAFNHQKINSAWIGLGSLASYWLVLVAFRMGPAGYIIAIRELSVVMGAAMGVIFLKEKIDLLKRAGILLIALGAFLLKIA